MSLYPKQRRMSRSWESPSEGRRRTDRQEGREHATWAGIPGLEAGQPALPPHHDSSFSRLSHSAQVSPRPLWSPPLRKTHCHTLGWAGTAIYNSEAGLAPPAVSASGPLTGVGVSWTAGGPEGVRQQWQPDGTDCHHRWLVPLLLGTDPLCSPHDRGRAGKPLLACVSKHPASPGWPRELGPSGSKGGLERRGHSAQPTLQTLGPPTQGHCWLIKNVFRSISTD